MHRSGMGSPAVTGVVHLGLGAFHRAHQACVFDQLIQQGDKRWGVFGVAMHNPDVLAALKTQGWQYAVQVASAQASHWQTIRAIQDGCVAALERQRVVDKLASADTRWVTLTVTEKGYNSALAQLLLEGFAARFAQLGVSSAARITLASCDNLSHNGDRLRDLCLNTLMHTKQDSAVKNLGDTTQLLAWIDKHCCFPNSMVDRIVPHSSDACLSAASDALGVEDKIALSTESFWEWVIEDKLADTSDAQALQSVGVQVVSDVQPFEEAKLRMLNASHSALAAMGAVLGLSTIADCMATSPLRNFAHRMMTEDIAPFVRRPHLDAYRDALLERFANPALQHRALQICSDNSLKLPLRWLPNYTANRLANQMPTHLAFATAGWIRFLKGVDESGNAYTWSDPLANHLQALAHQHWGNDQQSVLSLLEIISIWGDASSKDLAWIELVTHNLQAIRTQGLLQALHDHLEATP
jgi:fructuronate reductase